MRFSVAEKLGSVPGSSMRAPMCEGVPEKLRGRRAAFSPSTLRLPELGATSPAAIFMVVDLPAPFLPTKP